MELYRTCSFPMFWLVDFSSSWLKPYSNKSLFCSIYHALSLPHALFHAEQTVSWNSSTLVSRSLENAFSELPAWNRMSLLAASKSTKKEELKRLLMKVKEDSEKVGLKHNIQITKIMASGPITSWQIDGETMERVTDFILGGSKITADGDCSHVIKRHLLLGRKAMTNLDSISKSRDIAF